MNTNSMAQSSAIRATRPVSGRWFRTVGAGLMVAILCVFGHFAIPDDRWKLVVIGCAAVGMLAAITGSIRLLAPGLLTPLIFVGFQVLPALFFMLSLLVAPEVMLVTHPLPYLLENPMVTFVALILPSLGFWLFALVWWLFALVWSSVGAHVSEGRTLHHLIHRLPAHFDWLLIVAAMLQFSQWITTDERIVNTLPAYFLRVISRSMGFMPFFAGLTAFRYKRATAVWGVVFIVGIALSVFTGSRGYAFLPLIPFLIGLFIGLDSWRRRIRVGLVLAPFLGVAFFIGGLVGQLRTETGRLSLSEVPKVGVDRILEASKARVQRERAGAGEDVGITESGFARLVNWPNIVVPVMTPGIVPYRGFGDIGAEFSAFWELGKFSGRTYWANEFANEYGFMVNESTSVEFGIVADGASRGGVAGALAYGFIAAAVLASLERLGARLFVHRIGVFAMCLGALGTVAFFDMIRTGLFTSARSAILGFLVTGTLFLFVDVAASYLGATKQRNG